MWTGVIVSAVLLIALNIFLAQNSHKVTAHFRGLDAGISLALALLMSAVAGALLVAIPGTVRILQLRPSLKKNAASRRS